MRRLGGRRESPVRCRASVAAADQIVPVRDDIADRAARAAGRYAAVHAAGRLLAQLLLIPVRAVDLVVVVTALPRRKGESREFLVRE